MSGNGEGGRDRITRDDPARPPGDGRPRIVCIDDEPPILDVLQRLLRIRGVDWNIESYTDSELAWENLRHGDADVVVTDVSMPGLSGPDLLRLLRGNEATRDTPVVVLTGMDDAGLKRKVLDLGATDLLGKPIQADDLLARLRSALRLKQCQDALKRQNEHLEQMVLERTRQLQASRIEIIWRLAKAAEFRDEQTGSHVLRVAHYSRLIAEALGKPRTFVETLFLSAPLHDLGKIGIPDAILRKSGPLTDEERRIVRSHCEIGDRILGEPRNAERVWLMNRGTVPDGFPLADQDPVLCMAREIAFAHHERWDGGGYPRGLDCESIPLSARIVAIADVYDALTSVRPYKPAFDPDHAMNVVRLESGKHFDPEICDAFLWSWKPIEEIRGRLSDDDSFAPGQTACIEFPEILLASDSLLVASGGGS